MKVTFVEEIEHKCAWRECMFCRRCDSYRFIVHHQTEPTEEWWLECFNCGRKTEPASDYKTAKERWKNIL